MSHEPHPRTDRTAPGSTPAGDARANSALERQRAEGDLPGRPTRDPLHPDAEHDDATAEGQGGRVEVPPTETVPDEVAREAARSVDPSSSGVRDPDAEVRPDDPLHPSPSSSDVRGMPHGSD